MRTYRKCESRVRLDNKTAVITGSNAGLGKYTALDFYRRGCKVIMACRNIGKAEKAKEDILRETKNEKNLGELIIHYIDLSSLASVRSFADHILSSEDSINILVNNAGFCGDADNSEDGINFTMATNYFGPYLLTLLLLPIMLRSEPARIVNVSSVIYIAGKIRLNDLTLTKKQYSSQKSYFSSKLATVLFTRSLARKLEGTGVTVYALHPGFIHTDMVNNLRPLHRHIGNILFWPFWTTVENGAQTQIYCSVDEEVGRQNGLFYSNCRPQRLFRSARDDNLAGELWLKTWEILGLGSYDPQIKMNIKDSFATC